jgi:short-subunit dehydrogenase
VLVADLASPGDRCRVGGVLARPEVAMLVNNAGVSTHGEVVAASAAQVGSWWRSTRPPPPC